MRRTAAGSRILVEGLSSDRRGEIPPLQQRGSGFGEETGADVPVVALGDAPPLVQLFQLSLYTVQLITETFAF